MLLDGWICEFQQSTDIFFYLYTTKLRPNAMNSILFESINFIDTANHIFAKSILFDKNFCGMFQE